MLQSPRIRSAYLDQLRRLDLIPSTFLPSIFSLLSIGDRSRSFDASPYAVDEFYVDCKFQLVVWYFRSSYISTVSQYSKAHRSSHYLSSQPTFIIDRSKPSHLWFDSGGIDARTSSFITRYSSLHLDTALQSWSLKSWLIYETQLIRLEKSCEIMTILPSKSR